MKINYDQILIGKDEHGDFITADHKDGKITTLNQYVLIDENNSYDGNFYLVNWRCGGDFTVGGQTFRRGMKITEDFKPLNISEEELELLENAYDGNGSFCEECGTFHDTEQYYDVSFTITDCGGFYCKTCVPAEELLVEVKGADDIFRSKDMTGVDLPDEYEEVDTLFCDSSGFGSPNEPALTKDQAEQAVDDLIEQHGTLYAGLTGIGQFQVYVTLYKRVG